MVIKAQQWYEKSFRRLLIDFQNDDYYPESWAGFDTERYVEMVRLSGVDTIYINAMHNFGIHYWPIEGIYEGHSHRGLNGRGYSW